MGGGGGVSVFSKGSHRNVLTNNPRPLSRNVIGSQRGLGTSERGNLWPSAPQLSFIPSQNRYIV